MEATTVREAALDAIRLDAEKPRRVTITTRILPGDVARGTLALLGILLGAYLLWRVQEVLFLFFLAVLFATAIEPLVLRLRRGPFTRGSGTLVVYTAIILLIGIPAYLAVPNLVAQAASFTETLPDRLQALRPLAAELQPRAFSEAAVSALDRASNALRNPQAPEDQLVEAGATAARSIINFLTVFVLAFYWIVERASIKRVLLRSVSADRAREVNSIWMEVELKLGGWVRGQLSLMLLVGVVAGLGFSLIGLPNAALLGVGAGVLEVIPILGPFLAFSPALLVALAVDPAKALAVLIFAIVVQQIEGNILVPRIMGHTVGVSPLTVLLGILVGAALYGIPGAFLAVPVAGAVQVMLAHALRTEDSGQAEAHVPSSARPDPQAKEATKPAVRHAA